MLDEKIVNKIKNAARNVKRQNDSFYINGDNFSCRWNGKSFLWTGNGHTCENTAKEIIDKIADGLYIKDYFFCYVK